VKPRSGAASVERDLPDEVRRRASPGPGRACGAPTRTRAFSALGDLLELTSRERFGDGREGTRCRMAARHTRREQNQLTFRRGNEALRDVVESRVPEQTLVPFLCECADDGCLGRVEVTLDEWERVVASPNHFSSSASSDDARSISRDRCLRSLTPVVARRLRRGRRCAPAAADRSRR
jgi:hypothetical protein